MKKIILNYLRFSAVSIVSIAVFLAVAEHKIVLNEALAQCVPLPTVGGLNTSSLDGTSEGSAAESNLIGSGCIKLNNESYGGNTWMACPTNYYVAAITDDASDAQDVFCCPF